KQTTRSHVAPAPAGEVITRQHAGTKQQPVHRAPEASVERDVATRRFTEEAPGGRQAERRFLAAVRTVVAGCNSAAIAAALASRGLAGSPFANVGDRRRIDGDAGRHRSSCVPVSASMRARMPRKMFTS